MKAAAESNLLNVVDPMNTYYYWDFHQSAI
jgi:hypothetical protein